MIDEHAPYIEDFPAYALGALDPQESAALEAHLETCASCRAELAAYRKVSDNLLMTTPPQLPSPALRKRLQQKLPGAQKERRQGGWTFGRLAVGMALALLLIFNLVSFLQIQSLQRQQAQLIERVGRDQMALAMLSYPSTQSLPVESEEVSGALLLDRERNIALLVAWGMPPVPESQTYQIWLIDPEGNRVSGGLFRPETDQRFTTSPIFPDQSFSNFVGIGVTVEPAEGSPRPTGRRILKVDF